MSFFKVINIDNDQVSSRIETEAGKGYSLDSLDRNGYEATLVFRESSLSAQIEAGNLYRSHGVFTDLSIDTSAYVQFEANGKAVHISSFNVAPNAEEITVRVREAPTYTTGTSEVEPYNANRNSEKESVCVLYDDPTSVSGGTEIESIYLPGSSGIGQTRASDRYASSVEWILKENADYIFEFHNGGGNNVEIAWDLSWYEITQT